MLKFYPNGDRVLIRPFTQAEMRGVSFSILMIGDQTKTEAQQGVVIEAGPEAIYKVGDTVIFNAAAGDTLRAPDGAMFTEMRIVHSDTVLCRFTDA